MTTLHLMVDGSDSAYAADTVLHQRAVAMPIFLYSSTGGLQIISGQQNLDDGIRSRRELGTPAVGLDNLSDDRQAQAAAIRCRIGLAKAVE